MDGNSKSDAIFFIADGRKMRAAVNRWRSTRTVSCVTNVEAFALRAEDLEEVTSLYARYLRNARVQGAIRFVLFSFIVGPPSSGFAS